MVSIPFHLITGTVQLSVYGEPAVGVVTLPVIEMSNHVKNN